MQINSVAKYKIPNEGKWKKKENIQLKNKKEKSSVTDPLSLYFNRSTVFSINSENDTILHPRCCAMDVLKCFQFDAVCHIIYTFFRCNNCNCVRILMYRFLSLYFVNDILSEKIK